MRLNDDELREGVSRFEARAFWGGVVVFAGAGVDVLWAIYRPAVASPLGIWGPVIATVVVAIGIAAELYFSRRASHLQKELVSRSEERLGEMEMAAGFAEERAAEANQKAIEAELALCELEARLAPRKLSQDGQNRIAKILSVTPGISGQIGSAPTEIESMRLESAIHAALRMGGWDISRGQPTHTPMWPGGIVVNTTSDFFTILAGVTLAEALIEEELYAIVMPMLEGPAGQIFVTVGVKPEASALEEAKGIVKRLKAIIPGQNLPTSA